jgi:DNA-directed RNA polymerase specialized sigma24 family protein
MSDWGRQSRHAALAGVDDGPLLAAVAARRTQAIQAIYERHAGSLYSMAAIVLDDLRLAEEAVEQTFLRLWREVGAFYTEGQSLRAALAADVYDRCTRIRAKGVRTAVQKLNTRRDGALTSPALIQLAAPQRDLLALIVLGAHTRNQAARKAGLPEGVATRTIANFLRSSLL